MTLRDVIRRAYDDPMLPVNIAKPSCSGIVSPAPPPHPARVYIAGPYTQGDPVVNVRRAVHVADALLDAGLLPFVPHLSHLWHLIHPRPYEDWLAYDLGWLAACDVLLRLPGESKGADVEVQKARRLGLPVFYDAEALLLWWEDAKDGKLGY